MTEEMSGPAYTCPTPCDDDCEAVCHEAHAADIDRFHSVELCEANAAKGKRPVPDWYRNPTGCSCQACEGPYEPTWLEFIRVVEYQDPRPPMPAPDDELDPNMRIATRMMLCPVCGNKRCPAAADHRSRCTGSNEPGQPGSLYPLPESEPVKEIREVFAEEWEATGGAPDKLIHTRGPFEGQPIVPETEEEKRERYLANRDDPKEWG